MNWLLQRRARLVVTEVIGLLLLLGLTHVFAASANISHSYRSDEGVTTGSLVSLDPDRSDYVQLADSSNGARLLGVAVAGDDSLLAVDETAGKVQIANSGTVSTLVSTLNGSIHVGDQIGVSPFRGIGMKALPGSHAIGLAQTAFDTDTAGAVKRTVTDKQGKQTQLTVGYIRLNIAISSTTGSADGGQNTLQHLAFGLTGHNVSTLRAALSLVVVVTALLILITLIYASIYGSIISIGRNPLAKYAVFRTLGTVVGMALLTAVVSTVTVFFLLR